MSRKELVHELVAFKDGIAWDEYIITDDEGNIETWREPSPFDSETTDLYRWVIAMVKHIGLHEKENLGVMNQQETLMYWTARQSARKFAGTALNFLHAQKGKMVDEAMIEEMRKLCAHVAYD